MVYLDMTRGLNHIGRLGENAHRTFRFPDSVEVLAMYPDATVTLLHRRPGDPTGYPVAPGYVSIEGGCVYWTVQSGDVARKGRGKAELVITKGTTIAKNFIYDTMTDDALDGSGTPPDPWESWIAEVVEAGEHAPIIRNGVWYAWDISEGDYVNTGVNVGISGVTLNADYTLTISFTDGTSATVGPIRGAQGEQGEPGEDYVITQADYAAIAAIVMQDAGFQQKVDAAEAAADESRGWADGKHLDGTTNPQHSENNAEYFKEQCEELVGDLALEETQQAILDEAEDANALLRQIVDNPLETLAHTSERYAKGTEDGVAVESGVGYHDNSKYYKEQTEALATEVQQMTGTLAQETTLLAVKSEAEQATELLEDMVEAGTKYGQPSAATDGVYILQATVSNGAITYAWVAAS